jgi:hypothetical protein
MKQELSRNDSLPSQMDTDQDSAAKPQPKARGLTAEYAKYAENTLPPGSPSAYSAHSAVYFLPEDSSQ